AGHTHGGQVTLFGLWAPFYNSRYGQEYVSGIKKSGNSTMIISNGIGTVNVPVRFSAKPQIVVVTLKRVT
ncbi:MAG: metallophosphoesterase, partial [Methanobacterium aggregans]